MLLCIAGSLRAASTNVMLLREAAHHWPGDVEFADLRMPLYDRDDEAASGMPEAAERLADQATRARAALISTPEYNHSIPGGLKNALDWLSRKRPEPLLHKPVAVMAAAAGRGGGARGAHATRLVLHHFRVRISTGPEVLVAQSGQAFDADGRLKDEAARKLVAEAMARLAEEAGARAPAGGAT